MGTYSDLQCIRLPIRNTSSTPRTRFIRTSISTYTHICAPPLHTPLSLPLHLVVSATLTRGMQGRGAQKEARASPTDSPPPPVAVMDSFPQSGWRWKQIGMRGIHLAWGKLGEAASRVWRLLTRYLQPTYLSTCLLTSTFTSTYVGPRTLVVAASMGYRTARQVRRRQRPVSSLYQPYSRGCIQSKPEAVNE